MTFLAALLIVLIGPSFFLAFCCMWASWMAIGNMPVLLRMPIFLAGTLPISFTFCLYHSHALLGFGYGFWILVMPAAAAATGERKYVIGGVCLCLLGVLMGMSSPYPLEMSYFCTIPLGLCLLAVMISVLRLIGFQVIRLSLQYSEQQIELGTGKNLNEWIRELEQHGASRWKFADIMSYLRSFGFDYQLQKAITVAYEQSLGRRSVDFSSDGRSHKIAESSVFSSDYWSDRWGRNRFTVAQTLCWSVAAATLFAFFRYFADIAITLNAIVVGGPFLLVMAMTSIALLCATLGLRRPFYKVSPLLAVALLAALLLPLAIGNYGLGKVGIWAEYFILMVLAIIGSAGWMTAGLVLMRGHGYRLVRVQTVRDPQDGRAVSSSFFGGSVETA